MRRFDRAGQTAERGDAYRRALRESWELFVDMYRDGFCLSPGETDILMEDISALLQKTVDQYRSALDLAISHAVPRPGLQFPIANSRAEFDDLGNWLALLPDPCLTFIERVQPYNASVLNHGLLVFNSNRSLGILKDLSQEPGDGTRTRVFVTGAPEAQSDIGRLESPGWAIPQNRSEILTGADILGVDGQADMSRRAEDLNPLVGATLCTKNGPPPCAPNDTLFNRLGTINLTVKEIIRGFEQSFVDSSKIVSQ